MALLVSLSCAAKQHGVAVVEEGVLDGGLLGVEDLQRVVVDVAAEHTVLDVVCGGARQKRRWASSPEQPRGIHVGERSSSSMT